MEGATRSHGIGHVLKSWWGFYWAERARRTTVFMLRSLDDRVLTDIGLNRSEIESVVYGKLGERQHRYDPDWK
jgi:uncharacterized protein YjiS (DUF1127 family)